MGIDVHGLNFLRHSRKQGTFGDTVTIGRQALHVIAPRVKKLIAVAASYKQQAYIDALLTEYFGSTKVDSIDNSDYEKATVIHDMNLPLPGALRGRYDTVIDGGCLEHIYDAPQALENCSLLCKPGAQIVHILPTNNYSGHGFWQFSPELFFSLYSSQNGYADTEIFVADLSDESKWYQVKKPENGQRVRICSQTEVYVLVRTTLLTLDFSHSHVQQSDYVYQWEKNSPSVVKQSTGLKQALKNIDVLYRILQPVYASYLQSRSISRFWLNKKNPWLREVALKDFL